MLPSSSELVCVKLAYHLQVTVVSVRPLFLSDGDKTQSAALRVFPPLSQFQNFETDE